MKELSESEMLYRMAAYCSSAERSVGDVNKKLITLGAEEKCRETIIGKLIDNDFLNEQRYVTAFIHDKLHFNKWGRWKISSELRIKGIVGDFVEQSLKDIDESEYMDILKSLIQVKNKTLKVADQRERYFKLARFAIGKGFVPQEVTACLKKLFAETENFDCEESF